jgi:hypothetical protein
LLAHLALGALLLAGAQGSATAPQRVYVVSWASVRDAPPEHRALVEQADRELKAELKRRGALVVESPRAHRQAIVLSPSLEVFPGGLTLKLVGQRGWDRSLLGAISTKASGSSRAAQLKAVVRHVCEEAQQLEERR